MCTSEKTIQNEEIDKP